jgi:hypothetical protein
MPALALGSDCHARRWGVLAALICAAAFAPAHAEAADFAPDSATGWCPMYTTFKRLDGHA